MSLRYIAFYLPQFYPFPENNAWWGKGFTEWTNVTKAKPLFDGHEQPFLPADLGFYDLRLRETQHEQIALAKQYGIDAFCFHYYWFNGKRLLDIPVDSFLSDRSADMPFCLCWANENWTRRWDAAEHEILIEQNYDPGYETAFIDSVVPFFRDSRYLRVNGRPLLVVYRPQHMPDARQTAERWREHCRKIGIGEIHLVAALIRGNTTFEQFGFDAGVEFPPHNLTISTVNDAVPTYRPFNGAFFDYPSLAGNCLERNYRNTTVYRTVFPSWDNTARVADRALVVLGANPANYERWLSSATALTLAEREADEQLVFINAWNEWAEGCCLEPSRAFGRGFLEATLRVKQGQSVINPAYEQHPFVKLATQVVIAKANADSSARPSTDTTPQANVPLPTIAHRFRRLKLWAHHALRNHPTTFKLARLTFHLARRMAKPFRQSIHGPETAPVQITPIQLAHSGTKVSDRTAFMTAQKDAIWEAFASSAIHPKNRAVCWAEPGTRNAERLAKLLGDLSYEAQPLEFARYLNCIAHPYAIGLITQSNSLISESLAVYRYVDPSLLRLDYLGINGDVYFRSSHEPEFIDENVLLPFHASYAFGHYIFDALPQILYWEMEIKSGLLKIGLSTEHPAWLLNLLQYWDFTSDHILQLPTKAFRFRSAIISNALTTRTSFHPNPLPIEQYRESNRARASSHAPATSATAIYLTRDRTQSFSDRSIENELELIAALEKKGFCIVTPEALSYADQIELFKNASTIVGPHGSAFANLIWCRPGTRVIDLMPDDWVGFWGENGVTERWVARICAACDLQYEAVLCKSRAPGKWTAGQPAPAILSTVDLDSLLRQIAQPTPALTESS